MMIPIVQIPHVPRVVAHARNSCNNTAVFLLDFDASYTVHFLRTGIDCIVEWHADFLDLVPFAV